MSGSVNKAILIGNVGADPEIRRNQAGEPIANIRIATSESWRDKATGERKEKTEWHRIVVFGKLAEIVEQYVKKGQKLYIEGKIQTRKWSDQAGVEKYSTEVVLSGFQSVLTMLDKPKERDDQHHDQRDQVNGYASAHGRAQPGPGHTYKSDFDPDADIPF